MLATKAELKAGQDKIMKLPMFDWSYFCYFCGKNLLEVDAAQSYLVFQPFYWYFEKIANSNDISECESKGLLDESIKPPAASNNSPFPVTYHINSKLQVNCDGNCLKKE